MIEKKMFLIELDHNKALDIGDLTYEQWKEIEKRAQQVVKAGQTKNNKIAFVAAFLNYVSEMQSSEVPLSEVN
jgi:uncharacterized linocin/CFP29 family protein